jgi:hypothetical protein
METENKFRNALRWSIATAAITPRASETACNLLFFPVSGNRFTALPSLLLDDSQHQMPESARAERSADIHPPRNYDQFRLLSFTFYFTECQAALSSSNTTIHWKETARQRNRPKAHGRYSGQGQTTI